MYLSESSDWKRVYVNPTDTWEQISKSQSKKTKSKHRQKPLQTVYSILSSSDDHHTIVWCGVYTAHSVGYIRK